jgi:transcriptional regulator with XRE-family HTH domain
MTQGVLAQHVGIHVSQLRRYEAGNSSPTLDALRKLAIALSVSADTLIFDAERNSDEELRLQLEATQRLTTQDKELVKRFINGLLLSHEPNASQPNQAGSKRRAGYRAINARNATTAPATSRRSSSLNDERPSLSMSA